MINVYVHKVGKHYTGFHVKGHANYAEKGRDIVCAAVSALTLTLEAALVALTEGSIQTLRYIADEHARIYIMRPNEKTDLLVSAYCLGIKGVEESFHENVKLHLVT